MDTPSTPEIDTDQTVNPQPNPFIPISKMMERIKQHGDSDHVLFQELLYAGEFITKLTILSLVSAIEDDRENHRYEFLHKIVRAESLGTWLEALDGICTGPGIHIADSLTHEYRQFTRVLGRDTSLYRAVETLHQVLTGVSPLQTQLRSQRATTRQWFKLFVELRNKTRGHGALTPATSTKLVKTLQESIDLMVDQIPFFKLPWAYLHHNISEKYNVKELGGDNTPFSSLSRTITKEHYPDGIYIWSDRPRLVYLLKSDLDATDFLVPNGGYNEKTFELHSLISDDRERADASPYRAVASNRPPSETAGSEDLEVLGNVLTNLPKTSGEYVRRPNLERDVREKVMDDRHSVVTLVGRGGIGKTSLALTVLNEIADTDRYDLIVWFSARDIDLTPSGPKIVKPNTLTEKDIAQEYGRIIAGYEDCTSDNPMLDHMRDTEGKMSRLFVFDNFETVRRPVDLYEWISTNIRLPNKAIITTRFRDFKADYPIDVSGMEYQESRELIKRTAANLRISPLISSKKADDLIEESDGHPYVIKIILGEMADKGSFGKPSKMIARKVDILDALFERTYDNLSPLANRIFLTLSGWRSLVPQLALETVIRWRTSEPVDPEGAVDELLRMSLIERHVAQDGSDFLGVPITAALFGKRKFEVSQDRELIRDDIQFLRDLGPTSTSDLKRGSFPRVRSIFKRAAMQIAGGITTINEMRPMLEFVAHNDPRAWLLFADLERDLSRDKIAEVGNVQRFLEQRPHGSEAHRAWTRLVGIYRSMDNIAGACSAFLSAAEIEQPDISEISNMAHYVNSRREVISEKDPAHVSALFKPLAQLMERQRESASATDLSRLAWLYLHAGDSEAALVTAESGLKADPLNVHCERLVVNLNKSPHN